MVPLPPWPFGLDTVLGDILEMDKVEGDPGLEGYMKTWQWWPRVTVGGPMMMADWFSLCLCNVH